MPKMRGDTSYMLGGWSEIHSQGRGIRKWRPAKEMITAIINFAIATGRRLEDRRSREDDWDKNSDRESEEE